MTDEEYVQVLKDALYYFGFNHQQTKCIEEMSELTKEICKDKEGKGNVDHIAEEIADVLITINQMAIYYDIYEKVVEYRENKMDRLRHLIFLEKYG